MNIERLRAELEATERRTRVIRGRIDRAFVELPKAVGLSSVDALVERLLPYASKNLRIASKVPGTASKVPGTVGSGLPVRGSRKTRRGRPKGKRYSQEVQDRVKALLTAGKTAAAASAASGASPATINFWKRKWGMVRKRRRSRSKAPGAVGSGDRK